MSLYIEKCDAPANRKRHCEAGVEHHFTEGAVMIALAMHLLNNGFTEVEVHPDGEHGKRFDFSGCLSAQGFLRTNPKGKTSYGGSYEREQQTLTITVKPGLCDVVARMNGRVLVAECKGGIINTRHPGQKSKLRRGLCEAVGLLMARPLNGERQIAVAPLTPITEKIALRMIPRARAAGIDIALVNPQGEVTFLSANDSD